MTNYFKVYLKSNAGYQKYIAKNKEQVISILKQGQKDGFTRYLIIKTIKSNTDVPVAQGSLSKECKVVYVDGLDTDWRIVGANVVNWDKYKKAKEDEERC